MNFVGSIPFYIEGDGGFWITKHLILEFENKDYLVTIY